MSLFLPPHQTGPLEVNWDDPLNDGLVAWWPFRQQGGSTLIDVAGKNNGTINGVASEDWQGSGIANAKSLYIGTGTQHVALEVNEWQKCYCAWLKFESDQSETCCFFSVEQSNGYGLHIAFGASNLPIAYLGATSYRYFSSVSPFDNHWHHVAFFIDTANGANCRMFWDGKEVSGGASATGAAAAVVTNYIGCVRSVNNLAGQIADMRIYNRYLSGSEVVSLYQDSRKGYQTQFNRTQIPLSASEAVATGQYSDIFNSTIFGGSVIA